MPESLTYQTVPDSLIVETLFHQWIWVNSLVISQVSILTIPYFPQKVGPQPFWKLPLVSMAESSWLKKLLLEKCN